MMSQIDAGEASRTEAVADRVDDFRLAYRLIQEVRNVSEEPVSVLDVIRLAEFLGEG